LNVKIRDLAKYAMKSIAAGFAVWFVADVGKHFNPIYSTLDDQLDDRDLVFGRPRKFRKGDRITFRNVQGNHAMALTGFNLDDKGRPISWQVENSWGYYDHETPGADGFLFMSHSWFEKYVMEIVVHKEFLSRTTRRNLKKEPILLYPWDSMAPATRAGCVDAPRRYKTLMSSRR
jgi:bleomycin hydrolase